MARVSDKAALITGGGGGIGAATARLFCAEGAAVTLVDANAAALAATVEAIGHAVPGARIVRLDADGLSCGARRRRGQGCGAAEERAPRHLADRPLGRP